MDPQQSQQFFKQADALFRGGRYGDALIFLEKLNRAHPDQKNVLFPMAMCLTELGRGDEALPICDQLIATYDLPRAKALRERILAETPTVRTAPLSATPANASAVQANATREAPAPGRRRWPWILGLTIAVMLVALSGILFFSR